MESQNSITTNSTKSFLLDNYNSNLNSPIYIERENSNLSDASDMSYEDTQAIYNSIYSYRTIDFSDEEHLTHSELLLRLKEKSNVQKLILRNCTRIAVTILFDIVVLCPEIKEVDLSLTKSENCLMVQPSKFLSEQFVSREFSSIHDKLHLSVEKLNCSNHAEMTNKIFRNVIKLLCPKEYCSSSLQELILTGCPADIIDLQYMTQSQENKYFTSIKKFIAADGPYSSPASTLEWLNYFILNNKQLKELDASFSKYIPSTNFMLDKMYNPNVHGSEFFFTNLPQQLKKLNLDNRSELVLNHKALAGLLSHSKLQYVTLKTEFEINESIIFSKDSSQNTLIEITIRSKTIDDSVIQSLLLSSPKLEKLTLDGSVNVTKESINLEAFKNCKNFKELNLFNISQITSQEIDELTDAFDVYTI